MSTQALTNVRRGMIEGNRPKPSVLAFAVSLYRTDIMFRALLDLAFVGTITLAFVLSGLSPVGNRSHSVSSNAAQQSVAAKKADDTTPKLTSRDIQAGGLTLQATESLNLPDEIIAMSAPAVADVLRQARNLIVAQDAEDAFGVLERLDPNDPPVAYTLAVAILHRPGSGNAIEAIQRLRSATAKGFAPAFTLTGTILLRLVHLHEKGRLPDRELATLDGGGNRVPATTAQLIKEAVQWFERGAAFRDATAMRNLGLIEILGLAGRKNLAAAIAHWESAARLGDPVARTELGHLHMRGIGIEADPLKAAAYFRDAAAQKFVPAYIGLALALIIPSTKGDYEAAREAVAALKQTIRNTDEKEMAALAYTALGTYVHDLVAPEERAPDKATAYWMAAFNLGAPPSAHYLVRALRTGVGVEQDKPLAYVLSGELARFDPKLAKERDELAAELTPKEVARAATLSKTHFTLKHVPAVLRADGLLSSRGGSRQYYGSALPVRATPAVSSNFRDLVRQLDGNRARKK